MNWYKKAKKEECSGWLAVRLPQTPSNKIKQWGRKNVPDNILFKEDGKGRESDTHITILYGICADEVDVIKSLLKDQKPIKVTLKKIGFFKNSEDGFDPLIIKVESKDLNDLNERISYSLNIESTYSEYKPHCTIAYVKSGEAMQFAGNDVFNNTEIILNKIVFVNNKEEETEIILKKGK